MWSRGASDEVCLPRDIPTHTHLVAVDRVLRYPNNVGQEDFDIVVMEPCPMDNCCPVLDDPFPTLDQAFLTS